MWARVSARIHGLRTRQNVSNDKAIRRRQSPLAEFMILIVDDDPSVTTSLALLLKQAGRRSQSVSSPEEALARIEKEDFQLVLQDMNFSRTTTGAEGIELLKRLKARKPSLPVILITAWGSINLAVQGVRAGASDFITKPWTHQQIIQAVNTALELAAARSSSKHGHAPTRDELDLHYDFCALVGEDPKLLRTLELIGRIAATYASVLITGESGTGKELIADAIHRNSHRCDKPFVKVNLGGVPAQLFDSEMFGHVKGAFTDARADRKGRFETAGGGTIFLDEIGDLDASAQVKLLRVLQDRTYEALGSSQTRTVDVRVISATADEPQPGGDGLARAIPRRPALPPEPDRDSSAVAAGASDGHPAHCQPLHRKPFEGLSPRGPVN